MSLLLEALKKAEKAKEEAQRRARGEAEADAPSGGATVTATAPPVLTRDQLPDIRQPLEILEDDVPPKPEPRRPIAVEEPRSEAPAARPQPRAAANAPAQSEASRNTARKVFEAKFREPNPRLPFFITVGALGVFALGTVIYFWIQLRPPAPLVNANPKPPTGEAQVAAADKPAASATAAPTPAQSAIPGLPSSSPSAAVPAKPAAAAARPAPQAERAVEVPLIRPAARPTQTSVEAAPRAPAGPDVSTTRQTPQVHPKVNAGYAAYTAGDLATARTEYQQALADEPANRDALLGLAAVDVRTGRYEAAAAAYQKLLQADPRDSHAQAALAALRSGGSDPVAAESRVKSMLANDPGAHALNFTLGNQLAQQGRWAEAQQQYFKAFSAESDNADYAYNLAVSLDHLRQPKLALDYYQRALALAKTRGASFDLAAAQARIAQLGR